MNSGAGVRSICAVAGCLALWVVPGYAEGPEIVLVRMRVVVATNKGPARGVDEALCTTPVEVATNEAPARGADKARCTTPVANSLRRFPYASFRLLQSEERPVDMNSWAEFPVPGGRHLLVRPTGYEQGRVALSVALMQGRMALMNTVLRLRDRGEFVVAGPQQGDGVLFLSIGATMRPPASR